MDGNLVALIWFCVFIVVIMFISHLNSNRSKQNNTQRPVVVIAPPPQPVYRQPEPPMGLIDPNREPSSGIDVNKALELGVNYKTVSTPYSNTLEITQPKHQPPVINNDNRKTTIINQTNTPPLPPSNLPRGGNRH
jgi:hypothetical protein